MKILGTYEVTKLLTPTWLFILGVLAFVAFAAGLYFILKFADESKEKKAGLCAVATLLCFLIFMWAFIDVMTHIESFTVFNVELDHTMTLDEMSEQMEKISERYRIVEQDGYRLLLEEELGYDPIVRGGKLYVE